MPETASTDANRPAPGAAPYPLDRRDRAVGLGLIAVSFLVALGISVRAKEASLPVLATQPAPPSTAGIEGFPATVKPLLLVDAANALTPRDQLAGIAIVGAKPDGTVDVHSGGNARYVFRSPEGTGPEPEREYGELAFKKYCGFQVVSLTTAGLGAAPDVSNADCKRAIEALPQPGCSVEQLWELGKQRGADPERSATIEYYRASSGPAWAFTSGSANFSVAPDCRTVLSDEDRTPVLPSRVPS